MVGSSSSLLVLALSSIALGAPNIDATPTLSTGSQGPSSTHSKSLPGFVAHAASTPGNQDEAVSNQGSRPTGSNGDDSSPPPPPYVPVVTPAPEQDARLASQGYRQETYYTCNTVAGSAHCGWHLPLVKAPKAGGGAAALQSVGGAAAGTGAVVAAVACLAGVFALAMV